MSARLILGDCLERMGEIEAGSVHTCVTSPPYFGLRDYGVDGQIGLEPTPDAFVARLVEVFREVRRVLRDDGTLWLNLGDSYCPVNRGENARPRKETLVGINANNPHSDLPTRKETILAVKTMGIKPKDLIGIPWRVAFALQADGWYLRSEIIWHKPNPMPESVTDRPTKAHEQIFLLAKSERYFYDADAVREPFQTDPKENYPRRAKITGRGEQESSSASTAGAQQDKSGGYPPSGDGRNRRSVWTVATKPFKGAHFATFPEALIRPCILAGCPEGGTVLDPFAGAGTTGVVAVKHGRKFAGCEINPAYREMALKRIAQAQNATPLLV